MWKWNYEEATQVYQTMLRGFMEKMYLVALREKYNLKHKDETFKINVGDIVMINGGREKLGIR